MNISYLILSVLELITWFFFVIKIFLLRIPSHCSLTPLFPFKFCNLFLIFTLKSWSDNCIRDMLGVYFYCLPFPLTMGHIFLFLLTYNKVGYCGWYIVYSIFKIFSFIRICFTRQLSYWMIMLNLWAIKKIFFIEV